MDLLNLAPYESISLILHIKISLLVMSGTTQRLLWLCLKT